MTYLTKWTLVIAALVSTCAVDRAFASWQSSYFSCSSSPIQSTFAPAGQADGLCRRDTISEGELNSALDHRYLSFGSGYAEILYHRMEYGSYAIPYISVVKAMGILPDSVTEKMFDFGEMVAVKSGGEFEAISFKKSRGSCFGFSKLGKEIQAGYYGDHLYGYVCLRRPGMTEDDLKAFLDGLTIGDQR